MDCGWTENKITFPDKPGGISVELEYSNTIINIDPSQKPLCRKMSCDNILENYHYTNYGGFVANDLSNVFNLCEQDFAHPISKVEVISTSDNPLYVIRDIFTSNSILKLSIDKDGEAALNAKYTLNYCIGIDKDTDCELDDENDLFTEVVVIRNSIENNDDLFVEIDLANPDNPYHDKLTSSGFFIKFRSVDQNYNPEPWVVQDIVVDMSGPEITFSYSNPEYILVEQDIGMQFITEYSASKDANCEESIIKIFSQKPLSYTGYLHPNTNPYRLVIGESREVALSQMNDGLFNFKVICTDDYGNLGTKNMTFYINKNAVLDLTSLVVKQEVYGQTRQTPIMDGTTLNPGVTIRNLPFEFEINSFYSFAKSDCDIKLTSPYDNGLIEEYDFAEAIGSPRRMTSELINPLTLLSQRPQGTFKVSISCSDSPDGRTVEDTESFFLIIDHFSPKINMVGKIDGREDILSEFENRVVDGNNILYSVDIVDEYDSYELDCLVLFYRFHLF